MGDTRFSHGLAFGKVNSFAFNGAVSGTAGLIAEGDTTPDVTNGNLFYTNNTSTTVLTYFDLTTPHGTNLQAGLFEGKRITVLFLDDSTSLARTSQMVIAGSAGGAGSNNFVDLMFHNSAWIELNRSQNQNSVITVDSNGLGAAGIFNAQGVSLVRVNNAASSASILRRAILGEQGQRLTIFNAQSATQLVVNSAAADTFVDATSATTLATYIIANSSAVSFIRAGNRWIAERPLVTGSISWIL